MNTQNNLQQLPPHQRYLYFIKTLAETGELWTLIDENGNFALFEVEHTTVLSFWPEEHFIESNLTVDWQDYIPFKLDLDALEETVIPFMRQNKYLVNIFPVNSRTGHILPLNDFVNDFNNQLEH